MHRRSLYSMNMKCLKTFVSALSIVLMCSYAEAADDPDIKAAVEVADDLMGLGFSTAKLVWVSTRQPSLPEGMTPSVYSNLAANVQKRIDEGRAVANVAEANFKLIATSLTYAAVVDPEPLTKATAGLAAFAAKKTGDYIVELTINESRKHAMGILANGLESSGLTDTQLRSMTHEQIAAHVGDFQVGGKQIREILNDTESLRLVQDHMIDIVSDNALEALRRTEVVARSVEEIRNDVKAARDEITKVKNALDERATRIENKMTELVGAIENHSARLSTLESEVAKNTQSISSIAEISFSGWTTQQKLQAVRSDLFPDLTPEQKDAMVLSLEAQQKQEKLISDVASVASDLKAISQIANNLGLPSEIVNAANTAATIATGATQFLSGNYLGAIGSITSLGGMGAPDAGAERHRQMMKFLSEQFAQVNQKLDKIIDLQVKTIEALERLRQEQQDFRVEVLTKLGHVESITLTTNRILQALIRNEWRACDSLVNNSTMGGFFMIRDRQQLLEMMSDTTYRGYAISCHRTMSEFLDARILPGDWSGQVIAANAVPDELTPADDQIHQQLIKLQQIEETAYKTAAMLLLAAVDPADMKQRPARILARVAQPMASVGAQRKYAAALKETATDNALSSFLCNDGKTLATALKELLCFGSASSSTSPKDDRISRLFRTPMLGPQVERVIKEGVLLATFADLSFATGNDEIRLVKAADLEAVEAKQLSQDLKAAVGGRNGLKLLLKLRRLSESFVLQQAVTYGDYTAQVAEEALYDKTTRTLNPAPTDNVALAKAQAALAAMKANPVLARNVVLLAIRHAIADAQGGNDEGERVNFLETRYRWSYENFVRGDRCGNDEIALTEWKSLLPGWTIEYKATASEKARHADYANCQDAQTLNLGDNPEVGLGSGPSVKLGDFYVTLPKSMAMSIGRFEQPESLLRALALRDKVGQAIAERMMSETVATTVSGEGGSTAAIQRVSFDLLNAPIFPVQ